MHTVLIAKLTVAVALTIGLSSPAVSLATADAQLSAPTFASGATAGQITLK